MHRKTSSEGGYTSITFTVVAQQKKHHHSSEVIMHVLDSGLVKINEIFAFVYSILQQNTFDLTIHVKYC
jgi:hypothetical protein